LITIYCTVSYVFKLFQGRISQPNFTAELMVIDGHVHPYPSAGQQGRSGVEAGQQGAMATWSGVT
jgi:hypothetical protein